MLKEALKEYISLLDKRLYFQAHEILEEAWHPLRKANHPLRNLVKGLINASIAFEHIKRDRKNAKEKAQRVFIGYKKYKYIYSDNIKYYDLFAQAINRVELIRESKNII
jgi:predicted metal-dependent hydrolase